MIDYREFVTMIDYLRWFLVWLGISYIALHLGRR